MRRDSWATAVPNVYRDRLVGQALLATYDRLGARASLSSLLHSELGAQGIMIGLVASQVSRLDTMVVQGLVRDIWPHRLMEQLKEPGSRWALVQVTRGLLVGPEESADGR